MKDDAIIKAAREFFTRSESCESDNRKTWREDVRFARLGEQWPTAIRARREAEGRPCMTINKLGPVIRQVVNDARQNRPSIKVMPQDSNADPETAEVMTGLIRNIEQSSNADVAYDTAIDNAVSGGFGYWRVNLDYANDVALDNLDRYGPEAFEQDICIKRVTNPLAVYGDPDSTCADSSDWMQALVLDKMSEARFARKYPKAKKSGFDSGEWAQVPDGWKTDKEITVAEYWVREEVSVAVVAVQLADIPDPATGEVSMGGIVTMRIDDFEKQVRAGTLMGEQIGQPRNVKSYKVTQYIVTALEVLERNDWPGTYIPIIPVYGDEVTLDGKRFFRSLISDSRGAQEQHNFWITSATEMVALAPRMPYIGPRGAFKDARWQSINNATHPFVEYDGAVKPERQPLPALPSSDLQMALTASDAIKATTGIYDASLGARSNETSGRAIMARQREGDVSTFHFIDNLARAIRHTGKILLDLIPKVYSTARVVRIIGPDGAPSNATINQQYLVQSDTGQAVVRMHDFKAGRYDLAVSTGPSFTTKREEAASQMIELIRAYPAAAPIIGDLLAKNLDWPGADEIAERLKRMLDMQTGQQQPQGPSPADQAKMQIEGGKLQVQQFEAETDRMKVQVDAQQAMTPMQVQQIVVQTMRQMLPGIAA